MKTKEELNALKEEINSINQKLHELTEDELKQVIGGIGFIGNNQSPFRIPEGPCPKELRIYENGLTDFKSGER